MGHQGTLMYLPGNVAKRIATIFNVFGYQRERGFRRFSNPHDWVPKLNWNCLWTSLFILEPWWGRQLCVHQVPIQGRTCCHSNRLQPISCFKRLFSVQFSSVAQCPTLWYPMNRSTPGLPVHYQLPEFTQTHAHWVSDAIQQSHPLSSPSPSAPNPSNIRVFSNESTLCMR